MVSCYQKKDEAYLEFLDQICDGSLNGLGVDIPYQVCPMQPVVKLPCELHMILQLIQAFERTFDNASIVKSFSTNQKDASNNLSAFLEQMRESFGEHGHQAGRRDETQAQSAGIFSLMNHLQLSRSAGSQGEAPPKQQR